jgi:hypothetical protein
MKTIKIRAIEQEVESKEPKQECGVSPENELTGLARYLDEISSKYRFLKCPFSDSEISSLLKNESTISFPIEIKSQESTKRQGMDSDHPLSNTLPCSYQGTQQEMPTLVRKFGFEKNNEVFNYLDEECYSIYIHGEKCFLFVKNEMVTVYQFEDFFKTMALVIQN